MSGSPTPTRDELSAWIAVQLVRLELVDPSTPLSEDTGLFGRGIGLDSVDVLRLVVAIEAQYDLTLEDAELTPDKFSSVGTLADFITEKAAHR
ncbi:MAG: acyl carrier protein [Gammaproteobacteria bacterium]